MRATKRGEQEGQSESDVVVGCCANVYNPTTPLELVDSNPFHSVGNWKGNRPYRGSDVFCRHHIVVLYAENAEKLHTNTQTDTHTHTHTFCAHGSCS